MPQDIARCANISPSKRSFEETAYLPRPACVSQHHLAQYAVAANDHILHRHYSLPYPPSKRRSSFSQRNSMQAERDTIMSGSFPSFMSVYGSEESGLYRPMDIDDNSKLAQDAFPLMTTQTANIQTPQQHAKPYEHRGSITSTFSESTESSPSTDDSTFDSPLVSDTSSSNSPESATSSAPSAPFRNIMIPQEVQSIQPLIQDKQTQANTQEPQSMQDATKNVKKLTLNMNLPAIKRSATTTALDTSHPFSAPTSPLKEPMKSARKKPNGLTIRTPGYNQLSFPRATGNVPVTPGQRPTLHQYQSSPALSALASPRGPPAGGMFLPLPSLNTSHSKHNSISSNGGSFMTSSMPDLREEIESAIPKSQEAPEKGYTEGPVCIYDCGVYLYLEPTAVEASNFDIVINVAKEVKTPFASPQAGEGTVVAAWRAGQQQQQNRDSIIEPQTAISEHSFKSAWEWPQPESTITPATATPTQTSFIRTPKEPEYVHVKWDHNSEILADLYPLCKMIDERVVEGKKVLIHCQLGVSRSASLIIAYGLFKNYQPNFHSMYSAVKEKSRWVGPNMSLIYQLTDFKNKLNRGDYASASVQPKAEWFVRSQNESITPTAAKSVPAMAKPNSAIQLIEHTAAPEESFDNRPTPLRLDKALPAVPLSLKSEGSSPDLAELGTRPPPPVLKNPTTIKRAASRPLPFRERAMQMSIPEHRPRKVPGINIAQPSAVMDLAMKDVPSTPSLFSPRTTEFVAPPFDIRGAGDLETPGNRQSKEIPSSFSWLPLRKEAHVRTPSKDPRSPHQQTEVKEIYRSIDNYL